MASIEVRIPEAAFDPDAEAARFRRRFDNAGGVVSFVGQVRADAGRAARLALEHYPGYTERKIENFCVEAGERWMLDGVLVVHRVGEMVPGDAIVLVSAASPHRRAAFEATDFLMDYLKSEAPFWKREFDGVAWRWIEPTAQDRQDKARWTRETPACRE